MPSSTEQLVLRIHASDWQAVLAVTGGGATAIGRLLELPGASKTVLEAVVPYCQDALVEWLGGPPDRACSARTARAMAMAAFRRARRLSETGAPLVGVGCTASLATDRPKQGEHRVHLATQTEASTATWSLVLQKGHRSRAEEEELTCSLLVDLLAETCGVDPRRAWKLPAGEKIEHSKVVAPEPWQDLLAGRVDAICVGRVRHDDPEPEAAPRVLFPGAFNPLHVGHRRMATIAERLLGKPVAFEISVVNVDKPPLDYFEIERRLGQFRSNQPVWLTRLATFAEKCQRFPDTTFVVGIDTLQRIADPRYYYDDHYGCDNRVACQEAIERMAADGCQFMVFPRTKEGVCSTLDNLDLPSPLKAICRQIPPEQFREDISSTEIRSGGGW